MNFLKEIIEIIKSNGKNIKEVQWVGNPSYAYMNLEDFEKIADFEYENDHLVARDLLIVANDWWLEIEKHNSNDSDWREFKELPKKPKLYKNNFKIKYLNKKNNRGGLKSINK